MEMIKLYLVCFCAFHIIACSDTTIPAVELRDVELRDSSAIGGRIAAEKLYEITNQDFPLRVKGAVDKFSAESSISLRHNTGRTRSVGDEYIVEGTKWSGGEGELIGIDERREIEINHDVDITRYSVDLTLLPIKTNKSELDLGIGILFYDFDLKASALGKAASISDKGSSFAFVAGFRYFIAPELALAFHGKAYLLASQTQRDIDFGLEYQAFDWLRLNLSYFTYSGSIGRPEANTQYIVANDFCLNNPDDMGDRFTETCLGADLSGKTKIEFDSFSGLKAGATYIF